MVATCWSTLKSPLFSKTFTVNLPLSIPGLSPSSEESSSVESDSDPWASVVPVTISRSSVPKYFEASSNE